MSLVVAILREIARQCKERGLEPNVISRWSNSACRAATIVVEEFGKGQVLSCEGMTYSQWCISDDWGCSSKFIGHIILGLPIDPDHHLTHSVSYNYPHDSDDFGRCWRLLHYVLKEIRLNEQKWADACQRIAATGPEWKNLIEQWNTLEALFEADKFDELTAVIRKYTELK